MVIGARAIRENKGWLFCIANEQGEKGKQKQRDDGEEEEEGGGVEARRGRW